MTTDIIEFREGQDAAAAVGALLLKDADSAPKKNQWFSSLLPELAGVRSAPALSGASSAIENDAETLFRTLEQHDLERDGWKRGISATVALLRQAHMMIEKAESTIAAQSQRISLLEALATTDELTTLRNRRGFYEGFISELDRCERDLSTGGLLIMIDLDNFKAINDTYGHQAGDACLRLVARTLANEVRTMDVAARLGGDEFVLLLSNTTKKLAARRAQELAWRLNNLALAWYGDVIPVQASLGLQSYKKGDRIDRIFNDADAQLYASKARRKTTSAEEGARSA